MAAIDGRGKSVESIKDVGEDLGFNIDLQAVQRREGYLPSASQLACALGHQRIWRLLLERGLPYALVLEDDAVEATDLPMEVLLPVLDSKTPVIVQLSCRGEIFAEERTAGPGATPAVVKLRYPPRQTTAYAINRAAAQLASRSPIDGLADWPGFATNVHFFACLPWPFREELSPSTIQVGGPSPRGSLNSRGSRTLQLDADHAYRVWLPRMDSWLWRRRNRPTLGPGHEIWEPTLPTPLVRMIRGLARYTSSKAVRSRTKPTP